ncbi:MAG: hypothetical protein ACREDR_18775, partial [Blastocatellia bacterium]
MKYTARWIRAAIFFSLLALSLTYTSAIARHGTAKPSHGTLIVAIPTKDGLLVCADRRVHNDDGDRDNVTKIRPVNSNAFYAASGIVEAKNPQHQRVFDLFSVLDQSLRPTFYPLQMPGLVYEPKPLTVGGTDYFKAAGINIDATTPVTPIGGLIQMPGLVYEPKPLT